MRITGLEPTKKGRYALMVDGEFLFSLHRDTVLLTPWLQRDAEVTPPQLEDLRREDEVRQAKEKAMDYLSAAAQTGDMLREKLRRRYSEEAVEVAVCRMEELGLINDLDYSRRFAADAVNLRHYPKRRIAAELQRKGVSEEILSEVLAEITEETEIKTACRLLEKQYREKLCDRRERDKVKAALQRRGFGCETIRAAVNLVITDLPQAAPEETEPAEAGDIQGELLVLIRKKYLKNLTDRRGMEKAIAALYRRGYPLDEIRSAIKIILEQEEYCSDD